MLSSFKDLREQTGSGGDFILYNVKMQRQSFKRARIGFVKPIFIIAYGGGFIPLLKSQVIISVIILTELNNSFKLKLEDKLL